MAAKTADATAAEDCCRGYPGNGMLVSNTIAGLSDHANKDSVGVVSCVRLSSLYTLQNSTDLTCMSSFPGSRLELTR
jgi:hypothetical protein